MERPNYEDVRWDHGAAGAAIFALRYAADTIERTIGDCTRLGIDACQVWLGSHRTFFDEQRHTQNLDAGQLAGDCRDAANRLARADAEAHDEQTRRVRDRAEWERQEREREEEEARERERERERQLAKKP